MIPNVFGTGICSILVDWLKSDKNPDVLIDWLDGGGDLASSLSTSQPYYQILTSIPAQGVWPIRKALAEQSAVLLRRRPDLNSFGFDRNKVAYNLFSLCAGLQVPSELAAPLQAILKDEKLTGHYNGISLKRSLLDAVILNQNSPTDLRDLWIGFDRGAIPLRRRL